MVDGVDEYETVEVVVGIFVVTLSVDFVVADWVVVVDVVVKSGAAEVVDVDVAGALELAARAVSCSGVVNFGLEVGLAMPLENANNAQDSHTNL